MKKLSNRKATQLSKPWITKGIMAAIRVKKKLHASGDEVRYKHYRNKICTLIRLSKRRYYEKKPDKELLNFYIKGKKT